MKRPGQQESGEFQPRRGRPRKAEPGASVTTWVPAREADRLIRLANRHQVSVSAVIRHLLSARNQ